MVVAMIDRELPSNCRVVSQKKLEDFCHKIEQKLLVSLLFVSFMLQNLTEGIWKLSLMFFGTEEK